MDGGDTETSDDPVAEASALGEVVATIELTEADYVDAYLGYAKHHNQIQSFRKSIGFVLGVTAVVVAIGWPVRPGMWTAMVALFVAGFFLVRHQWVFIAKRAFANLHEKRRRYELVVDARGRFGKGPRAEVRSAWATVSGWHETDRVILVFSPLGLVDLFPKRAFDAAQLTTLRALFDAYIVAPPPAPAVEAAPKQGGLSPGVKTFLLWMLLITVFYAVYRFSAGAP